jgi:hypothetical protein
MLRLSTSPFIEHLPFTGNLKSRFVGLPVGSLSCPMRGAVVVIAPRWSTSDGSTD